MKVRRIRRSSMTQPSYVRGSRRRLPRLELLEERVVLSSASTYTVTTLADSNPPAGTLSLRAAIMDANADGNTNPSKPDVIKFAVAGTINLQSALPVLLGSVSIQGQSSAMPTIQGDPVIGDTILTVGGSAHATISSLIVSGATDAGHKLTISDSDILVEQGGSLDVENSVITLGLNNHYAGGVTSLGGTVVINNSTLVGNFGYEGGAIANIGGSLSVNQTTIGGLYAFNSSTLAGNAAFIAGGGIFNSADQSGAGGQLTVTKSTIWGDFGNFFGGGIALVGGSQATFVDSTIAANESGSGGGIGVLPYSVFHSISVHVSGSTISQNVVETANNGGGIWIEASPISTDVVLTDTIVAGNGVGIQDMHGNTTVTVADDIVGAFDTASSYNLIGDGAGSTGLTGNIQNNQVGSNTRVIDPELGPLQNNGGPTWTMALMPRSPAIDRGGPDPVLDSLTTTDERGQPRVYKQPFVLPPFGGDSRDVGAFELQSAGPATVLTVNSTADSSPPVGVLTLREAIEAANGILPLSALPPGQVTPGSGYSYVIQFSTTGTIALGSALPTIASNLTINGPGAAKLLIEGDTTIGDNVLTVGSGVTATVSGVTIAGARVTPGSVQVYDSDFLVEQSGSLNLQNSVVELGYNNFYAGGIVSLGGTVAVNNSTLVANFGYLGGAISNIGGSLSINQSTIGGVLVAGAITLTGNDAFSAGGGVFNSSDQNGGGGELTVSNSTIWDDFGNFFGGGIALVGGSQATITNSTITENQSGSGAGIAVLLYSQYYSPISLHVTSSTIAENFVEADIVQRNGGGIWINPGPQTIDVVLTDTIVANNGVGSQSGHQGFTITVPDDISGAFDSASSFNLIGDGTGSTGLAAGVRNNQVGTDAQVIDPKLGPLQANGGPTWTMEVLAGSPALNTGSGQATTATDQRGAPRLKIANIGAYQATPFQIVVGFPRGTTAGVAQKISVEVLDQFGKNSYGFNDTIRLTSSDSKAVLPGGPLALTGGSGTFMGTLETVGTQSITATDSINPALKGSRTGIIVYAPVP